MKALTVAIPEDVRAFVEAQVAERRMDSVEAYVGELLRAEQRRQAQQRLEALLLEGLQSPSEPVTPEWWEQFRADLRARHAKGEQA
jgi:antitoxin ParD1/3/4